MRSHSQKQSEDATIDLTPMLDVVFIMLIFFIVTATFVKESGLEVNAAETELRDLADKASIIVGISPDDVVYIQQKPVDVEAVGLTIELLLAENPKGTVVIKPDKGTQVVTYKKVQEAIQKAGAENIIMATAEK